MSKPKVKKPVRWTAKQQYLIKNVAGIGGGILNVRIAAAYGLALSYWWHVEEQMLYLLDDLLTGKPADFYQNDLSARHIFRKTISQRSRIEIMRALLESMPHNAGLPVVYDEILDEFTSLNGIRNSYVHGIWHTELSSMDVYWKHSGSEHDVFEVPSIVTEADLDGLLARMRALAEKIALRARPAP